jgi:hypothetical protein
MIAWLMLKNNEPYRYAIPRSTETKLAKLRVKATGQRRKSGTPKGAKRQTLLPGGGRTIRSLAAVCQSEGLPEPRELSNGERRTVESAGCQAFVAETAATQVLPRSSRRPTTASGKSTGSSSLLQENGHGRD